MKVLISGAPSPRGLSVLQASKKAEELLGSGKAVLVLVTEGGSHVERAPALAR